MKLKLPKFPNNRRTWTTLGCSAAGVALATGGWVWWNSLPPDPDDDPKDVVAYVATEQFAELAADQKQPYLDAVESEPGKFFQAARESNLSDDQRREAMGNFFMARMEKQVNEYFALAPGSERDAYLDKLIDEMDQRRSEWASRARQGGGPGGGGNNQGMNRTGADGRGGGGPGMGGGGGGRGGGGGGGWGANPERMKNRMERVPPGTRAKMAEFRKAMRDRRQQRGRGR